MCIGPFAPKAPSVPAPPPPPSESAAAIAARRESRERQRAQAIGGRSSTILTTGAEGVENTSVRRKTLLGQ